MCLVLRGSFGRSTAAQQLQELSLEKSVFAIPYRSLALRRSLGRSTRLREEIEAELAQVKAVIAHATVRQELGPQAAAGSLADQTWKNRLDAARVVSAVAAKGGPRVSPLQQFGVPVASVHSGGVSWMERDKFMEERAAGQALRETGVEPLKLYENTAAPTNGMWTSSTPMDAATRAGVGRGFDYT